LKSLASSEWSITWSEPTLFLGTSTLTAAKLVPPKATRSAAHATTIAGVGRRILPSMITPFVFSWEARS
jgi:hypothetical protein